MMGAGGFIRNPGWENLSGDELMDEDFDNVVIDNFYTDEDELDVNSPVVLFLPTEMEDDFDDIDDDADDDDYIPSDFAAEDSEYDDAEDASSDDSAESKY